MSEFKLVPEKMLLAKETIEAINFHCGDGGDNFGEYSEGLLWVGAVTDDEGKEVYGLHLATAEYPEEGSTTLVEFQAPEDAAQSELDALREELAKFEGEIVAALPGVRFMDMPDGGSPTLGEQVKRMSEALTAAEQRNAELVELLRRIGETWNVSDPTDDDRACWAAIDAAIAAPAVERQPQVAVGKTLSFVRQTNGEHQFVIGLGLSHDQGQDLIIQRASVCVKIKLIGNDQCRVIVEESPAPVSVVLPERATDDVMAKQDASSRCWLNGWNYCLDRVKELNQ